MVVINDHVYQGSAADLVLETKDTNGDPLDLGSDPTVNVVNPKGVLVVSGGIAQRESKGVYVYGYQSQVSDLLGYYKATFIASVEDTTERVVIRFQVVPN